jgi:hypothetical protein
LRTSSPPNTFVKLTPNLPPAGELARRLIDGTRDDGAPSADAARSAAMAFDHLYQSLSRWVGFDGCHALFTRAHANARATHPLLANIQLRARATPYLAGVAETVDQHGAAQTVEALESMLVVLIELLGRLIGDDMARTLIERDLAGSADGDGNRESRRAKA